MSSDVILVKEHGCIYGWTNGTYSDNAISIQTMVTRTMATQKMVGQNMVSRNMVTPNMGGWNLVTPNMVCRNLVTLNMVTPKLLGTRYTEHNHIVVFNIGDKPKNSDPR